MRPLLALLVALAPANPALSHNAASGLGLERVFESFQTDLGLARATPACVTRVFAAGEQPPQPGRIDQITCLDQQCHAREIVLCAPHD